jgi:hypothetical protein
MGQRTLKQNRRALRKTARQEKSNIVTHYMTENWDKVLVSAVSLIRQFNFKNRFQIAMTILFKPIKKKSGKTELDESRDNGGWKDPAAAPPRPAVSPPPQKPQASKAGA